MTPKPILYLYDPYLNLLYYNVRQNCQLLRTIYLWIESKGLADLFLLFHLPLSISQLYHEEYAFGFIPCLMSIGVSSRDYAYRFKCGNFKFILKQSYLGKIYSSIRFIDYDYLTGIWSLYCTIKEYLLFPNWDYNSSWVTRPISTSFDPLWSLLVDTARFHVHYMCHIIWLILYRLLRICGLLTYTV